VSDRRPTDRKNLPSSRNVSELRLSTFLERKARADNKIPDSPGGDDLTRLGILEQA